MRNRITAFLRALAGRRRITRTLTAFENMATELRAGVAHLDAAIDANIERIIARRDKQVKQHAEHEAAIVSLRGTNTAHAAEQDRALRLATKLEEFTA